MALLGSQADYQFRHSNKEPEWSSLCNNVFDQYLDADDPFGFGADHHGRHSSDDSVNLFDFSGASEQSHHTDSTSPMPSWEPIVQQAAIEAQQPKAKESVDFWAKTLRALEQNAAETERQQQKILRSTKSHPDFLSLGGYPSPPAVPGSPTDQSFPVQQRQSRSTANGKRRNVTARSVSRGRPTGVLKATIAGCGKLYDTVRKCSVSPSKMMTPSRYRAGYKDAWTDKLESNPIRYELRVPAAALPVSPPPSARFLQEDRFAAFGSPSHYSLLSNDDDQMSPLTNTFQQARIHSPISSSATNADAFARNQNFEPLLPVTSHPYGSQTVSLDDTAPLYPERTSSLATNQIQAFDFGFDEPVDPISWTAQPGTVQRQSSRYISHDPFLESNILPTTEISDLHLPGLGISCDPSLVSNLIPSVPSTRISGLPYYTTAAAGNPYYNALHHQPALRSAHYRSRSLARSQTPSPPTEPRSRKSTSRRSASASASRHRRARSTNSTPRRSRNTEEGGFVNFTPHDSNKILSGVAPSGSSKTKARRDKEAAEKRRKLSQAAVKAVVDAGGDLEALTKAGVL